MGEHKDRDAQFQKINRLKKEYLEAGKPVLSIVDQVFEKGRKYAEEFKVRMRIKFDNILPNFNYTAVPALE